MENGKCNNKKPTFFSQKPTEFLLNQKICEQSLNGPLQEKFENNEGANRRKTNNTMSKRKSRKGQTIVYKKLDTEN